MKSILIFNGKNFNACKKHLMQDENVKSVVLERELVDKKEIKSGRILETYRSRIKYVVDVSEIHKDSPLETRYIIEGQQVL